MSPTQKTAHVPLRQASAVIEVAEGIDGAIQELRAWNSLR